LLLAIQAFWQDALLCNNTPQSAFASPFFLCLLLIVFALFSCYIYLMTIEQTVEIPASHRITIEVPHELPTGKAKVELTITPETMPKDKTVRPLASLAGIDKGLDTMDAYFARKRAEEAGEFPILWIK